MESNYSQEAELDDKIAPTEADMDSRITTDAVPTPSGKANSVSTHSYVKSLNDALVNAVD